MALARSVAYSGCGLSVQDFRAVDLEETSGAVVPVHDVSLGSIAQSLPKRSAMILRRRRFEPTVRLGNHRTRVEAGKRQGGMFLSTIRWQLDRAAMYFFVESICLKLLDGCPQRSPCILTLALFVARLREIVRIV